MTALAQNKIEQADVTVNTGNLPLSSTSATIYISIQGSLPAFSLSDTNDPCYTGGIAWNNLPNQTLTITFNWSDPSIRRLSATTSAAPNLSFGPVGTSTQTCTVQANCFANEQFTVIIAEGQSQNALLVITPVVFAGNLPLPSQNPVDVYVSIQCSVASFSLSERTGPYYSGGLAWNGAEGDLTINFHWTDTYISYLTGSSNISFGVVTHSGGTSTQACTVPATAGNDGFNVNLSDGTHHDPIIVVTPINN